MAFPAILMQMIPSILAGLGGTQQQQQSGGVPPINLPDLIPDIASPIGGLIRGFSEGGSLGGIFGGGTTGGQEKYLIATYGTGDQGIIRSRLAGCGVPGAQTIPLTLPLSTYGITPAQAMSGCVGGGLAGGLGGGILSGLSGPGGGLVLGATGPIIGDIPMGGTLQSAIRFRKKMIKCVCRSLARSGCR